MLTPNAHPSTSAFEVGEYAIVPSAEYPTYPCYEYDGSGWEVLIMRRQGATAVVKFTRARTASGRPYMDAHLQVGVLRSP